MEIIFDCPHCGQELSVDSSGVGQEIDCPTCHETIEIPAESKKSASGSEAHAPILAPSAIHASAAAKIERHLKVPVRDKPSEILIAKPNPALGVKKSVDGKKQLRTHTIRRAACIESGHDKFDEVVTSFLNDVGEENIKDIYTISYNYFDVVTQKILVDYGVLVLYRG
ncbi:MAG TPA: hypothetical protein VFV23_14270 [Verrucomicrobiae bacterium]|nr:hypothetical protein [Verrucomicrobiae bacterium]